MQITAAHALAFGILQGLTEFLPVSSSAHLILLPRFFHWEDPGLAFDVALHLGTLVGVVLYFWRDLWTFLQAFLKPSDPQKAPLRTTVGLLILATIPGALAGLILEHRVETVFRSPLLIAVSMISLGAFLALADYLSSEKKTLADMTWKVALIVGVAQGLALIPGVSRSGITITAALALGFQRREAARFSFLMSIPIIAGAGLLKLKQILIAPEHLPLAIGFLGAGISGLLAISFLMRFVQTRRYTPFVVYRFLLGTLILLNLNRFG